MSLSGKSRVPQFTPVSPPRNRPSSSCAVCPALCGRRGGPSFADATGGGYSGGTLGCHWRLARQCIGWRSGAPSCADAKGGRSYVVRAQWCRARAKKDPPADARSRPKDHRQRRAAGFAIRHFPETPAFAPDALCTGSPNQTERRRRAPHPAAAGWGIAIKPTTSNQKLLSNSPV